MGYSTYRKGEKKHCKKCGHERCSCSRKTRGGGHAPGVTNYYLNEHGKYVLRKNKNKTGYYMMEKLFFTIIFF